MSTGTTQNNELDWITKEYFREILDKDFPGFHQILKFDVKPATGPGENYGSTILRVNIDVELPNSSIVKTSYILKTPLPKQDTKAFEREIEIYSSILPQFEKLFKEAGKTVSFAPEIKLIENFPERITIVIEDLRQKCFKNIDRCCGLDMRHMEEALKKLAEFHAASVVYHERFGPFAEHFKKSYINEETRQIFKEHGKMKDKMFHNVLRDWGGCEKYITIWPSFNKVLGWFMEQDKIALNEFKVLNHGDCWSNNIMFQHNEQDEIKDTLFIDYQVCKWGSPAQDLYCLITCSAAHEIKTAQFENFIKLYHEHLAENLKLLNYHKSIPSLQDIHILMVKYSLWGFFIATSSMMFVLMKPNPKASLESNINDTEYQKSCLMNPSYVKAMKQLLPWWENRGVFDF